MTKKAMLLSMIDYLQIQSRYKNINIDYIIKKGMIKNKKELNQVYNLYVMGYYRDFESKLYNDIVC